MPEKTKVLLIRLDKIGDLICTLPVDDVLDEKKYDVTWVVQKGLGKIVDLGTKKRKYVELDKLDSAKSTVALSELIKKLKPDAAISFQCPWWVNFELFKNRLPIRAGVQSQWHSFLFLNQGLRQKRSLAEKHEFQYNLDLVLKTFDLKETKEFHYFQITKPVNQNTLSKFGLNEKNYIVVHPGMMGSALNWPQSEYINYINQQIAKNKNVVITGTDQDEAYLTEIKKEFQNHPKVTWLQSKLSLPELVEILSYAEYTLAPSTGVAHLAASVGASVKAIFSPVRVHHPRRWAPRGPNVEIFMLDEKTLKAEII